MHRRDKNDRCNATELCVICALLNTYTVVNIYCHLHQNVLAHLIKIPKMTVTENHSINPVR